jgi:hypothetical protein
MARGTEFLHAIVVTVFTSLGWVLDKQVRLFFFEEASTDLWFLSSEAVAALSVFLGSMIVLVCFLLVKIWVSGWNTCASQLVYRHADSNTCCRTFGFVSVMLILFVQLMFAQIFILRPILSIAQLTWLFHLGCSGLLTLVCCRKQSTTSTNFRWLLELATLGVIAVLFFAVYADLLPTIFSPELHPTADPTWPSVGGTTAPLVGLSETGWLLLVFVLYVWFFILGRLDDTTRDKRRDGGYNLVTSPLGGYHMAAIESYPGFGYAGLLAGAVVSLVFVVTRVSHSDSTTGT